MEFELTAGERVDVDFAPQNVQMEIFTKLQYNT